MLDRSDFWPGERGLVEVNFLDEDNLSKLIHLGTKLYFGEGPQILGEIEINKIY